jgi:hypothetical protein
MIAKFPFAVLLPGIAFLLIGAWYVWRGARLRDGSDLGDRLYRANRQVGLVTLLFGAMLIAVGIPLGIAIYQLSA